MKKGGISLVALVITIIVLIILTGAVIATFMEGGIIDNAKGAVFKNDIRTYQEILALKRAEEQIDIATGTGGTSKLNGETAEEIQVFLPEFKKEEYEGIIIVVDGEIMLAEGYEDVATDKQEEWIADLGLSEKPWDNSHEDALVINTDTGVLSGIKAEYQTPADGIYYDIPAKYTNLIIPDTVTTINGAFTYCNNLTSVKIPDSVTTIGDAAFASCRNLTSVNIPNSVTTIGGSAFAGTTKLTSINIPNSVTSIGAGAFTGIALTNVTIPNSITSIPDSMFYYASNLKSVTIPDTITSIGMYAFADTGLTDIYYEGTEEQWNTISKHEEWDINTGNYTVHYAK